MAVMPKTIGGYRILNEIGSGGFGTVYRARDPLNDRDVALKVLTDPDDLVRFRREARLAYEIGHPNIIRIFHLGEDGGDSFIVMELMQVSLREVLNTGRLTISRAVDICRQVALGLRAAHNHERKITHRDIKPDNILIDSNGVVKISDFGIAHVDDSPSLTKTGVGFGSEYYMSPEQFLDAKRVDPRADIYSLGVTFYEMLTGTLPEKMTQTPRQVLRIRYIELPGGDSEWLSERLEHVVNKCIELYPEQRYQTMDELLHAISTTEIAFVANAIDMLESLENTREILDQIEMLERCLTSD